MLRLTCVSVWLWQSKNSRSIFTMCGYRLVCSWFWPWLHLWCCSLGYESWVLINPCILGVVPSSQSKTWWLYDSIMVLVQRTRTTHLICGVAALDGIISIEIFVILCVSDSWWSSVAQCSTYPVWDSTHHCSHLVCCCDAQNVLPKCSHRNAESAGRDAAIMELLTGYVMWVWLQVYIAAHDIWSEPVCCIELYLYIGIQHRWWPLITRFGWIECIFVPLNTLPCFMAAYYKHKTVECS